MKTREKLAKYFKTNKTNVIGIAVIALIVGVVAYVVTRPLGSPQDQMNTVSSNLVSSN